MQNWIKKSLIAFNHCTLGDYVLRKEAIAGMGGPETSLSWGHPDNIAQQHHQPGPTGEIFPTCPSCLVMLRWFKRCDDIVRIHKWRERNEQRLLMNISECQR